MDAPFPAELIPCIEAFLADDAKRPPGLDLYEDCFTSSLFFPLQRREELRWMIRKAREINQTVCPTCKGEGTIQQDHDYCSETIGCPHCMGELKVGGPVTVMEIGADKGAGVYHWAKCLPTVRNVIACEIRGLPYCKQFDKAFPDVRFLWWACCSRTGDRLQGISDPAQDTKRWLTSVAIDELEGHSIDFQPIDVLFIDGDKLAFGKDFDAYLPLMNPNGLVFFHDINEREPLAAYRRVCARGYHHEEKIDVTDTTEAVRREAQGLPSANPHEGWLRHWRGRSAGVGLIYLEGKR